MSRAVASHHCGLGSIHVPSVKRRLSFSLVLFFAPWVFLLRSPPSAKNQHFEFLIQPGNSGQEEPTRGFSNAKFF